MRDIPAVPTGISAVLHDSASLHSTAGKILRRPGKYPDALDRRIVNWNARPVLHGASLQGSARYAGQRIHGPTSSSTNQLGPVIPLLSDSWRASTPRCVGQMARGNIATMLRDMG